MKTKVRLEGLTLTVQNVKRSVAFYTKIGFVCEWNSAPAFALLRLGGKNGLTIGLLSWEAAKKDGVSKTDTKQKRSIHVELSTDNLDALYEELVAKGIKFSEPPHDEPWERSATAFDPDGYAIEIAEGRRGQKKKSRALKTNVAARLAGQNS